MIPYALHAVRSSRPPMALHALHAVRCSDPPAALHAQHRASSRAPATPMGDGPASPCTRSDRWRLRLLRGWLGVAGIVPATVRVLGLVALLVSGCGAPFNIETPPHFVELKKQAPSYDYRAVSPDGVVVALRVIHDTRGDLSFWADAITLRLRRAAGYALLEAKNVQSGDGTWGRLLKFGHDENGRPHLYMITVFLAQDRLFLLEAGGPKDAVLSKMPDIEAERQSLRLRCSNWLTPVFASHTCNRW